MLTMLMSFPFTLLFETPFILLTKLMFEKTPTREPAVKEVVQENGSTTSVITTIS